MIFGEQNEKLREAIRLIGEVAEELTGSSARILNTVAADLIEEHAYLTS